MVDNNDREAVVDRLAVEAVISYTMKETTKEPLVVLTDVTKQFTLPGGVVVPILHGISLNIYKGEIVIILGASGSGKSTLMNIIGGVDRPTSGSYTFMGAVVGAMTADELAEMRATKISFVFQSFHLLPGKSVYQNVKLPLLYQRGFTGDYDTTVATALRHAALDESQWYKKPNQLSGGQRQRVAIARALVAQPALLLADEPTGNLDSKTGVTIVDSLVELNKTFGTTIVIVTHDESLTRIADRVVHIIDGRISHIDTLHTA